MKTLAILFAALGMMPVAQADETLEHKSAILELMRQAESALRGATGTEDVYRLAKARAWAELALDEMYEIDRTGIIEAAIEQAQKLLAGDKTGLYDTPIVRGSEKIRDDLWQKSALMKQHRHADCAMRELASLDVQLVWAGHEKWESGWTHARPYVGVAENLAYEAEQNIARCTEARAPRAVPVAAPSITNTIMVEKTILSANVEFQTNKSGLEQMAAGGQRKLAALADALKGWKSIEQIEIVGHADRMGNDAHNDRLSRARAENVRDFLAAHGLPAEKMTVIGMGAAKPIVHCDDSKDTAGRIGCLQPNRRVEIIVRGEKQ